MDADWVNAFGTVLSAVAALVAVFVAGVAVVEVRRIDRRAQTRERNERDDALQSRLEAAYPDIYRVFGTPRDGIPPASRRAVISYFGLYADVFTARRDGLLPPADVDEFLREFDFWAGSDNARLAWGDLRRQTWPDGFQDHVDAVLGATDRGYADVALAPANEMWIPGLQSPVRFLPDPEAELLSTASMSMWLLRVAGSAELPPSHLDGESVSESGDNYLRWLEGSDWPVWRRWVAVHDGRVVGHVCICPPHPYLEGHLGAASSASETCRLFVEPGLQRSGVGGRLLDLAVEFSSSAGCTPYAVVLDSSGQLDWYERRGWSRAASFHGTQGLNHVLQHVHGAPIALDDTVSREPR